MADDRYERYFAEKIWGMIPEVYRHEDGLAEDPGVLRALVEILAREAAVVRRSHDRLWEDQFVELADDWAVPYIGDLVGTRLVSALNLRGRRVDVAKTIYYRRRKGTLAVLEELIADIAGWEGTVVEAFRRLGRARHRLDPPPARERGPWTGTPPGGWADVRSPRGAALAGGPFDELHHTPDIRRHRGRDGRHAIPKIAFHLYRLRAWEIAAGTPAVPFGGDPTPAGEARGAFTFDPSGRDVPLFMRRSRPQDPATPTEPARWGRWRPAREWELPGPMPCRLLGSPPGEDDPPTPQAEARAHLLGLPAPGGNGDGPPPTPSVEVREAGAPAADAASTVGARLDGWTTPADDPLVIDPGRGRFLLETESPAGELRVRYVHGFSGPVGAGAYARPGVGDRTPDEVRAGGGSLPSAGILNDGVVQIADSATYTLEGDKIRVRDLTLQAAEYRRPYLRIGEGEGNWVLNTSVELEDSRILLDGLWIGLQGPPGGPPPRAVVLRGDYERVALRHVTLDPGGEARIADAPPPGTRVHAVPLRVDADVELLEIDASITGPIVVTDDATVGQIRIRDSIVQGGPDETEPVVEAATGEVILERVTVLGGIDVRRLWATEALLDGPVAIADTQRGCFRFGAARRGERLPHPHESHRFGPGEGDAFFVSRRFGDPGYGQLAREAPEEIRRGAENGSEIGALSRLRNPIRLESLRAKVEEYLPFGRIPIYVYET